MTSTVDPNREPSFTLRVVESESGADRTVELQNVPAGGVTLRLRLGAAGEEWAVRIKDTCAEHTAPLLHGHEDHVVRVSRSNVVRDLADSSVASTWEAAMLEIESDASRAEEAAALPPVTW